MKKLLIASLFAFWTQPALAAEDIALALAPQQKLAAGKSVTVTATLTRIEGNSPVTPDELKTVHTQKFHLLVIDPSFADYQHIHPEPTATPGVYSFTFTPKFKGGYRAWADITPESTGEQQFVMADLGTPKTLGIRHKESDSAIVGKYRFGLSFEEAPMAGSETMGGITVTDSKGKPFTQLEPVMGAYAHIVGFYDDYQTVIHTHPMGDEPENDTDRGGPDLMFHLAPDQAGFVRLFAQVRIGGKDIFVPFNVNVAPAS